MSKPDKLDEGNSWTTNTATYQEYVCEKIAGKWITVTKQFHDSIKRIASIYDPAYFPDHPEGSQGSE